MSLSIALLTCIFLFRKDKESSIASKFSHLKVYKWQLPGFTERGWHGLKKSFDTSPVWYTEVLLGPKPPQWRKLVVQRSWRSRPALHQQTATMNPILFSVYTGKSEAEKCFLKHSRVSGHRHSLRGLVGWNCEGEKLLALWLLHGAPGTAPSALTRKNYQSLAGKPWVVCCCSLPEQHSGNRNGKHETLQNC